MKTTTSIKLDEDIKRKAQKLAQELGLSLSTLVNAQLRQFDRDKRAVFTQAPQMTSGLEGFLGMIERDIQKEKNLSKPIKTKKDLDSFFKAL